MRSRACDPLFRVLLPSYAKSPVNSKLIQDQKAAASRLPANSVKAVRDWPRDANGSPLDYDTEPPPV
jgi:hypothetical protein